MSGVILLAGAPFSGCSLLAQMLGSHPQCAAAPELKLGLADTVDGLLTLADLSQVPLLDGLLRFIAEHHGGGQHRAGIRRAKDWLEAGREASTAALLAELTEAVAPRLLVIPDGEAALRPDELLRWQRLAPGLRVVQCLRHPLTHGAVWAPWLHGQLYVPPDYRDHRVSPEAALVEPQIPWLRCNRNLQRWVPEAQRTQFRLDDLETDPLTALRALCAALGLDDGDAALAAMQAIRGSPFAGWGPPEAPGGLEMDALAPVIDQALAIAAPPSLEAEAPWQAEQEGGSRTLDAAVVALARQYGYT